MPDALEAVFVSGEYLQAETNVQDLMGPKGVATYPNEEMRMAAIFEELRKDGLLLILQSGWHNLNLNRPKIIKGDHHHAHVIASRGPRGIGERI